ncbi:MAG: 4-hydroxy-tetrahydrodipicolinate reductase [Bacteroidales bacterium]|nr:4-hydroxy-tetrahydrodipicolinate reductase [Bacteroidales bacterium]MBR7027616.1 4-hydroxy-tetrahydrodipicolinate reductase [Bacteroidales bacterium]
MEILVSGYGKMGHIIERMVLERGLPYAGWSEAVTETPAAVAKNCVCIDFTTPDAIRANYRFIAENFGAAVIGTTGWNDIEADVKQYFAVQGTTLIYASNFSIGVNLLFAAADNLAKMAARFGGYKPAIEEIHHIHKLDAPSGTAKSLAAIVDAQMGCQTPIESKRIGEVPGTHILTLESACDRITLSHEAFSREGLAAGAIEAALMAQKVKGVYEFKELMFSDKI